MQSPLIPLVIWLAAAALSAAGQGYLMSAIRRTPPGAEAKQQSFALHILLTLAYAVPVLLAWQTWPAMLIARAVAFNPILNLTAGRPAFEVGATAWSDRALRRLAPGRPDRLLFVAWLACIAAAGWYYCKM